MRVLDILGGFVIAIIIAAGMFHLTSWFLTRGVKAPPHDGDSK